MSTEFKPFTYNIWDSPYLTSAGPDFAAMYVAFHPFKRVPGLLPNDWPIFDGIDTSGWMTIDKRRSYGVHAYEKRHVQPVSWQEVIASAGLRDASQLVHAYCTLSDRMAVDRRDDASAELLSNYLERDAVELPDDDRIPPILEAKIGALYSSLRVDTIIVANTFAHEFRSAKAIDLCDRNKSFQEINNTPDPGITFSPNHDIMTVNVVNDPYMLIFMKPAALKVIDPSKLLEGFWADAATDGTWWCPQFRK